MREPAKKNMYKGVSTAYGIIVMTYWQLAFCGYWAFGNAVEPYIVASLTTPEWTTVMANLFAVIQISGCFQVYSFHVTTFFSRSNFKLFFKGYKLWYHVNMMHLLTLESC